MLFKGDLTKNVLKTTIKYVDPAYNGAKSQNTKSHKTNIKHSQRIHFAVKKVTSCVFR